MTCHVGEGIVICTGVGPWRSAGIDHCPWCLEQRRCVFTPVFGGWCGEDRMCGTCGSRWSTDEGGFRKLTEEQREKNIATVAAVPDPQCWKCWDSGVIESPLGLTDCDCAAPGEAGVLPMGRPRKGEK